MTMLRGAGNPRWRLRRHVAAAAVAVAVALTGLLAGCGTSTGSGASPPAAQDPAVSPVTVHTLAGEPITLPAAGKPTLLVFYSVECGGCVDVIKRISSVSVDFPSAAYVAVNVAGEDNATMQEFLDYINNPAIVGVTDGTGVANAFSVKALSTVVVTDTTGHIVLQAIEPSTAAMTSAVKQAST